MNFFLAMCVSLHSHAIQVVNTDKLYFWTKYHIVCIFSIGEIFSDAKMVCIRTIFFIYLGSKNVIKKCIERFIVIFVYCKLLISRKGILTLTL